MSPYQLNHPSTMWCELGFLFHMMTIVQNACIEGADFEKMVIPASFQQAFQQVPEAGKIWGLDTVNDIRTLVVHICTHA
jgi:hypothetical protein